MCTFNGEPFLEAQLESIALQTRLPDELIVCDDRSDDKTLDILEEFANRAAFPVRVSVNERRLGTSGNFERAIRLANGEVIALADQDDVWDGRKLGLLDAKFSTSPGIGLIFTDAELVDELLSPKGQTLWEAVGFDSRRQELVTRGKSLNVLLANNVVTGATMAFRARFRKAVLPIPAEGGLYHDGWIALIISGLADIGFVDQPLIKYRQHAAQQVGAPITSTVQNVRSARRTDRNYYRARAAQLQQARGRLELHQSELSSPQVLSVVDKKIAHLESRARMPEQRLNRLPLVVRETLNLNYYHFSRGLYSAAKDLLI
jgi:glycosyltransferase involved in cell wall biosynthesis